MSGRVPSCPPRWAPTRHFLGAVHSVCVPTSTSAPRSPSWCSQPYSTHVFEPQKAGTTSEVTRGNPLRLIVALSSSGTAWGDLFWDDGESLDTFERGSYSYLVFNVTQVACRGECRAEGSCSTRPPRAHATPSCRTSSPPPSSTPALRPPRSPLTC